MTIKIKAPIILLTDDDFREHVTIYLAERVSHEEKKYRVVAESDWRKLMRLVKACEAHAADEENIGLHWMDAVAALDALEKKK